MRYLFLALLTLTTACDQVKKIVKVGGNYDSDISTTAYGEKIIIMLGQSNAQGRGQSSEFQSEANLFITYDTKTGPIYYAGLRLAQSYPSMRITLVNCTQGGTPIQFFMPGTRNYTECINDLKTRRDINHAEIIGMMFYQGESDTREWLNTEWPNQFKDLVRCYRSDLGLSKLPVVWAQLGYYNEQKYDWKTNWQTFKDNQKSIQLDHAIMITTDDQPVVDDVHHGYEANRIIGDRFFLGLLNLVDIKP